MLQRKKMTNYNRKAKSFYFYFLIFLKCSSGLTMYLLKSLKISSLRRVIIENT